MTHLEKFIALYREFGIECKIVTQKSDGKQIIFLDPDDQEKIIAKRGIISIIVFDEHGNFLRQGVIN